MWREKFLPTKRHSSKTKIQTCVTEGEAGHQLVQPGGQLAVHVHPSRAGEIAEPVGHVRGPAAKHGGELVRCGGAARAGGTTRAGEGDRSGLGAQGLSVDIPRTE